jgi:uncharacterized oligopeptide transporter (OPT) family protein
MARTDRDLSMKVVLGGSVALIVAILLARPLHMNLVGAVLIVALGFLFVTVSSRLTGEIGSTSNPISGMTVATLLFTCLVFLLVGWTGPTYYVTALSVGAIVCIASSNGGTTSQDLKTGFLIGATPRSQQIAIMVGALASALVLGPILLQLNNAATVYVPRVSKEPVEGAAGRTMRDVENFPGTMRVDATTLSERQSYDGREYLVWRNQDLGTGPVGKYLVDPGGAPVYLVDPGINGTHRYSADGTREVAKFDAPKATLMSYIIKGILNRELPWGLVLLGAMIALVLEMSGIASLAFAVGVYLPLSSTSPIFIGGLIRWLGDLHVRRKHRGHPVTEDQLTAEGDRSPGVLLASGYIAGGAIAGIVIAFMAGVLSDFTGRITNWAAANNPFFEGPNANLLSLLPFAGLVVLLLLVSREVLMAPKGSREIGD